MKIPFHKKIRYDLLNKSYFKQAINTLAKLEKQYSKPEDRIHIPFQYKGNGYYKSIKPMQSFHEINELYSKILDSKPARILEIGTCHGGTLYLWAQCINQGGTIISIDLPEGEFGGGYPPQKIPFYKHFSGAQSKVILMREDSHDPETVNKAHHAFEDHPVDFLFIDGDHTYEGVKKDFELYRSLVRKGGYIALHDILVRPSNPDIEVYKFWDEIKDKYSSQEFVETDESLRKIGIGLIHVD